MAPEIKYTYFNAAGRGEIVRLTMLIGKIAFDDDRVTFAQWPAMKSKMPLGSLPVAEIDGKAVVQTMALARYFGKQSGLYPEDSWKALMVDQVTETVTDLLVAFNSFKGKDKDQLREAREKQIKVDVPRYWGGCEKMLESISSGPFVLGDKVSIADLAIANIYLLLRSEILEFLPHDTLDKYPRMMKAFRSVIAIPEVTEWYKNNPVPKLDL